MKKIISIALICSMILSASSYLHIYGENTESQLKTNQEKQEKLDQDINELNDKIDSVENKINLNTEEISKLNKESKKLQEKIEKIEKNTRKNKDVLGERLKVINNNYTLGYLKVILSSNSISEFLNNIYMVKEVVAQDKQILKDLEKDKTEIEKEQNKLEENKKKLKVTKEELVDNKSSLEENKKELNKLKKELEDEEEKLEEELQKIALEESKKVEEAKKLEESKKSTPNKKVSSDSENDSSSSKKVISDGSWPLPGHTSISSNFGYRIHPTLGVRKLHTGIDIPAPTGTSAVAVASGEVIYSGVQGSYGNVIMIKHDNGIVSLYAHNSSLVVKVGQKVTKGQVVSKVGSTGRSTGPHLHFEIRVNGTPKNPLSYLK